MAQSEARDPISESALWQVGYNVLVRGATSLLSQSGLASLERACDSQVVVSGSLDISDSF